MNRIALVATALFFFACDPGNGSSSPASDGEGNFGSGKLFMSWTIGGQVPSDSACTGIDHLTLTLDDNYQTATIDPIPCTLTRFRYDGLFDGPSTVRLDALDTAGCAVATGQSPVDLSATLPAAPTPTVAIATLGSRVCPR